MKISGIYLIINTVNDKIYVGSAADAEAYLKGNSND